MQARLDPSQHHKTKNARGYMHPVTQIGREFAFFSKTAAPTIDMGCAYGNTVIAALDAGATSIFACDMEGQHLDTLADQLNETEKQRVIFKQDTLPEGFDFSNNSIAGIHASLILPYLNEQELDESLGKFYQWLKPGGKLFILCYSIYIRELVNSVFETEYAMRLESGRKWPGYLEDFSKYSSDEFDPSAFPVTLHFFDKNVIAPTLERIGFTIESAEYLDGQTNGAVEDTWHDGREFVGVVAMKP